MRLKVTFRQRPPYTENPAAVGQLAKIIYKDKRHQCIVSVCLVFMCTAHAIEISAHVGKPVAIFLQASASVVLSMNTHKYLIIVAE